jgi:hypothetical protein
MNPENVHATRAQHVARMVRDRIVAEARKEVRSRIEAADGKWSDWAGIARNAMIAYLESAGPRDVIVYHATQRTHPRFWHGRPSDALNMAARRATREIGPLMAYQALIRALDAVCEASGEASPLVQRLRENDREARQE